MMPVGAPVGPFTRSVQYVAATFWVSIFPVLSTLVAPGLLVGLPQGQELLNTITDDQIFPDLGHFEHPLHFVLFLAALQAWSFANWYASRLLLQRDFLSPAAGFMYQWNVWFPRGLATLGALIIDAYILIGRHQWRAGGIATLLTVVFFIFLIVRRRVLKLTGPLTGRTHLLTGDRIALWLSLSLSFVLLATLADVNWWVARFLGSPVILLLGLGSIVIMGAVVFTYLPLSYGWPGLAWLPLLVAFVLGLGSLNRNHSITPRLIETKSASAPRPPILPHFARWLASHPGGIVLVAAEGGASRSAWWTSHVLSALDYASDGRFSRHVYAISGVSGGSLGAATYVALLADRAAAPASLGRPSSPRAPVRFPTLQECLQMRQASDLVPLPVKSECFLGRDFLSTTLGYLLFPDLLQRFLPFEVDAWDRSLGLEQTWQNDWRLLFTSSAAPRNRFAEPFDQLYIKEDGQIDDQLPILMLNSTRAERGRAVLQSPLSVPSSELDDLFDPHLHTRGLPLSAAVHNSARFPLVSPGGEVETRSGQPWDALVDGGYFENSGAATLAEFIRALQNCKDLMTTQCPFDADQIRSILERVHVVFIMNDPTNVRSVLMQAAAPSDFFDPGTLIPEEELLTPLEGLYDPRGARGDSSKRFLVSLLPSGPDARRKVTEVFLTVPARADQPAMSWYLNISSRTLMWRSLVAQESSLCNLLAEVDPDSVADCAHRIEEFASP